ncbi:hypothetical protein E4U41_002869, partial [Claviceps citrina]
MTLLGRTSWPTTLRRLLLLLLLLCSQHFQLTAAIPAPSPAVPTNPVVPITAAAANAASIIPNRYIVVYNSSFGSHAIEAKMSLFSAAIRKRNLHRRGLGGRQLSTDILAFRMNQWRAMALDADDSMIADINGADEVAFVEPDQWISASATLAQTNAPPGLRRLSEDQPGQASYVFDESAGEGTTVYVVDTGVRISHVEFGGRARYGGNFVDARPDGGGGLN